MEVDENVLLVLLGKKTLELELLRNELQRYKQLYADSQNTVEELQQRLRGASSGC